MSTKEKYNTESTDGDERENKSDDEDTRKWERAREQY